MSPTSPWTQDFVEHAVLDSFLGEINALKPGNVHRFAGGHGMRYEEFLVSAQVSAPILCEPGLSLGARCLGAIQATRDAIGTNTNLGMVLLFAPIICAAQHGGTPRSLAAGIDNVIASAEHADVAQVFAAIALANPGGLGHVPAHDVHREPDCSLLEAMSAAAGRDWVARQYTTAFGDLFEVGLPLLERYSTGGNGVEWATVRCYLRFLASFPDSHILRKHGAQVAGQVSQRAEAALAEFEQHKDPGTMTSQLLGLDREWKDAGINPGTSADLTAASLLLYHLGVESRG
jgi:triphosphoribosyl-dephospho-CoA synthase